jgi:hypothetical protein
VNEYALTRIGIEPSREYLFPNIVRSVASNIKEADIADVTADLPPGIFSILGSYASVMEDFMARLKSEYGGAEGYVKNHLGLTDQDIKEIRENLQPRAQL